MTLSSKYFDTTNQDTLKRAIIEESEKDKLGVKSPSVKTLAEKYNISVNDLMERVMKGIAVEREHTDDIFTASEIARDHLNEDLEYYTKLEEVEKEE